MTSWSCCSIKNSRAISRQVPRSSCRLFAPRRRLLTCCCCRADNRALSSCLPLASKHDLLHHLHCQGRGNAPIMSMNDRKDSRRGSRRMRLLSHIRFLLLAFLLVHACSALPLFMVKSGRGKCVTAVAAEGTALQVNYEAPGTFPTNGFERVLM